jgi:DNA-binding NtrC family response regulator
MRSYLIVDDNRALAENLAEIVRDRGDEAVVAGSGPEALAILARRRFDAVLTDMRMPVMDGAELVREVRRSDPGVPTIVITAFFKDAGIRAALGEGPLAVLPKPVPVDQLMRLLDVARRNGRVVVVEDDAMLLDNLGEILQQRGFSTFALRRVADIAALPERPPLLSIVDLRVADAVDGESARRLAERYPGTPILAITGHSDIPVPPAARRLFVKPFDTSELVAVIEELHEAAARG